MNHFIGILLLLFAVSCSENHQDKHQGKNYLGLYIDNGPRRGSQYFDALGIEYNYRYFTSTFTNDTVVPIQLKFALLKEFNFPCSSDSQKFKVLLLPSNLKNLPRDFKSVLDINKENPNTLNKVIKPKEKFAVTFGILTLSNHLDFFQSAIISKGHAFYFNGHDSLIKQTLSTKNPLSLSLALDLLTSPKDSFACYSIIPCGQISFPQ
jgi:hypothetical protein